MYLRKAAVTSLVLSNYLCDGCSGSPQNFVTESTKPRFRLSTSPDLHHTAPSALYSGTVEHQDDEEQLNHARYSRIFLC